MSRPKFSACNGCKERNSHCHGTCKRYKDEKDAHDRSREVEQQKRNDERALDYMEIKRDVRINRFYKAK